MNVRSLAPLLIQIALATPLVAAGASAFAAVVPFSPASLAGHVRTLASDSFQGRAPGTLGETRTIDYIAEAMRRVGLAPAVNGHWLQPVALVETRIGSAASLAFATPRGAVPLARDVEFVIWSDRRAPPRILARTPVVFAGYGIVAPEIARDDYRGMDVRGKVVLVLEGHPKLPPSAEPNAWTGKAYAHFSPDAYDASGEAARRGAAAVITIHKSDSEYPWGVVQASWGSPRMALDLKPDGPEPPPFEAWLTDAAVDRLFQGAGTSLAAERKRADQSGFGAHPLALTLAAALDPKVRRFTSHNVIGQIRGSARPDETVIYTAHWDHFGTKLGPNGTQIFRGAMDNASGVAAILELGRRFAHAPPPRRTVLFAALTGEEEGLLGADWYIRHPLHSIPKLAVNLNIDTLLAIGPTRDVVQSGRGRSPMIDGLLDAAAARRGRKIVFGPETSEQVYQRADHLLFARAGVPIVTLASGYDSIAHGAKWGHAQTDRYDTELYHKPGDAFGPDLDFVGNAQDLELWYDVGRSIADSARWPDWAAQAEFRGIRDISAAERADPDKVHP